jgi:hypothetical protein
VSQGITPDDWDNWVDDRETHTEMAPSGPSVENYAGDGTDTTYGWTDLTQYGGWSYVPGAGYGWTPNGVNPDWSPFSVGQWCWYPGFGYAWIGAEPWGWLPYHYGSWDFIAGMGWVWFPGSFTTWSPGRVTWFHGPNWVGWIPRPHRPNAAIACDNNCGGAVVSTSTFRHGGLLTANLMLKVNPTTGERVRAPGVTPSLAARLPGRAVPASAPQSQGFHGNSVQAPGGATASTAATTPSRSPRSGVAPPNSTIVYDSQQDRYVNGHRVTAQEAPASRREATAPFAPAPNPGFIQPAPGANQERTGTSPESAGFRTGTAPGDANPSYSVPARAGTLSSRQEPSAPRNSGSEVRAVGGNGQAGGNHPWATAPSTTHAAPSSPASSGGGGHPSGGGGGGGGAPAGGHH